MSAPCLQRQVAKLASGLFYCWSLLRYNYIARNLESSLQGLVVGYTGAMPSDFSLDLVIFTLI